jgi:hypothetical protein
MSPNMRANVLQEILIDGQTAGPGTPSVDITDSHGKFSFFFFFTLFLSKKKNYNLPCSITIINVCVYLFKLYLFMENRAIHREV